MLDFTNLPTKKNELNPSCWTKEKVRGAVHCLLVFSFKYYSIMEVKECLY